MKNLYAVVDNDSNAAYAVIEESIIPMFPGNKILEVENTGATTFRTEHGTIQALAIYTESDGTYYIINDWPDKISLLGAYELIK